MPALRQMTHSRCRTADVVLDHAVRGDPARGPVDEHQLGAGLPGGQVGLVGRDRRDDQAGDLSAQQGLDCWALDIGVVAEAGHDHRGFPTAGVTFHRLDDGPEECVRDVRNGDADRAVPAGAEGLREHVGYVLQFRDRVLDSCLDQCRDVPVAIDHPGHGLPADPGQCSHLAHGAHSRSSPAGSRRLCHR